MFILSSSLVKEKIKVKKFLKISQISRAKIPMDSLVLEFKLNRLRPLDSLVNQGSFLF